MGRNLTEEQRDQVRAIVDMKLLYHEPSRTPWYDLKGWNLIPIGFFSVIGVCILMLLAGTIPSVITEWQKVLG